MNALRFTFATSAAAAVTFCLFLLMQALVTSGRASPAELEIFSGIRFGPVEIPDEIRSRSRVRPKPPPPPDELPPPPRMPAAQPSERLHDMPRMDIPVLDLPATGGGGLFIGQLTPTDQAAEGEVIPVVVIRPMYPRDAAMSGTEGWVKIEFTITETGEVRNPRVIEADPPRVFDREAIRAILKWKFKPRVVDGVAVERRAVQVIDFSLGDS